MMLPALTDAGALMISVGLCLMFLTATAYLMYTAGRDISEREKERKEVKRWDDYRKKNANGSKG